MVDIPVCSQITVAGGRTVALESMGEIIKLITHHSYEMIFPIPGEANFGILQEYKV